VVCWDDARAARGKPLYAPPTPLRRAADPETTLPHRFGCEPADCVALIDRLPDPPPAPIAVPDDDAWDAFLKKEAKARVAVRSLYLLALACTASGFITWVFLLTHGRI
jgi:hypothetical protein